MKRTSPRANPAHVLILGVVVLMSLGHSPHALQTEPNGLTLQERRGKDIYFGLATEIKARVGTPPTEAPAMLLACANCHGSDGRGKREGTVASSDITWEALTKPYGITHQSGRTHASYTERLLVRAVSLGVDPAGNALHAAMPRFQMSHADIDALTQYLKRLSTDASPGVSDGEIRLATLVPGAGPLAAAGDAARAVLAAYFDALNSRGGIYGRRIELNVGQVGGGSNAKAIVDTFLQDAAPFAIVGGLLAGIDNDAIAPIESRGVPFVGPLTIFPELSAPGRSTFYLLAGVEQQARALVDYSRDVAGTSRASLAIVHSAEAVPSNVAARIQDHVAHTDWNVRTVSLDRETTTARAIADELKRTAATHALLLVTDERALQIVTEMAAIDCNAALLVPGSLATNDLLRLPQSSAARLLIALPSLPSDQTQDALAEYRGLADKYHLTSTHIAWQLAALGSAKVLKRALEDAGRGLTRPALVAALEDLSDFDSGLMPRIRFSRGRHIGARGAYIVTIDPDRKELRQLTGWRPVN